MANRTTEQARAHPLITGFIIGIIVCTLATWFVEMWYGFECCNEITKYTCCNETTTSTIRTCGYAKVDKWYECTTQYCDNPDQICFPKGDYEDWINATEFECKCKEVDDIEL